jgi:hypothetical protein
MKAVKIFYEISQNFLNIRKRIGYARSIVEEI